MGGALFSQPWRDVTTNYKENLSFVRSYQPRNNKVNHLRILLHGPVGAGKSSFINSVDSVLQGRITGRALTDAVSGSSFTKNYTTYKIQKEDPEAFYSFIFNDIMGFEKQHNSGVCVKDIRLALMGHVKNDYKFIPGQPLTESDLGYNSCPTLDDRVHVLVSVIPADSLAVMSDEVVKKMREVRLAASDMGIPQLAILTKVDKACPKVQQNIKNVYKSKHLKTLVEEFHMLLGIPLNCIFPVKNYDIEINTNEDVNALILAPLRQMIQFGEDFIKNV